MWLSSITGELDKGWVYFGESNVKCTKNWRLDWSMCIEKLISVWMYLLDKELILDKILFIMKITHSEVYDRLLADLSRSTSLRGIIA